tara:strand:- start:154 stop:444 length:291 start_codon:yes stop_codon:yes gene_type:complete
VNSIKSLFAIAALTVSASAIAGSTAGNVDTSLQLDTIEKKLTLSCYNNRMGDRAFIGAPETISFCRTAARQAVSQAVEAKTMEIAALTQESAVKVN